eukprot:1408653-Rhodomonas_salina.6
MMSFYTPKSNTSSHIRRLSSLPGAVRGVGHQPLSLQRHSEPTDGSRSEPRGQRGRSFARSAEPHNLRQDQRLRVVHKMTMIVSREQGF